MGRSKPLNQKTRESKSIMATITKPEKKVDRWHLNFLVIGSTALHCTNDQLHWEGDICLHWVYSCLRKPWLQHRSTCVTPSNIPWNPLTQQEMGPALSTPPSLSPLSFLYSSLGSSWKYYSACPVLCPIPVSSVLLYFPQLFIAFQGSALVHFLIFFLLMKCLSLHVVWYF